MRLSLHKDSLGVHATIPSESNCFGAFGLLQPAHVQFPRLWVVVIYGRNGRVFGFELFTGIEDQDGQMLLHVSID